MKRASEERKLFAFVASACLHRNGGKEGNKAHGLHAHHQDDAHCVGAADHGDVSHLAVQWIVSEIISLEGDFST